MRNSHIAMPSWTPRRTKTRRAITLIELLLVLALLVVMASMAAPLVNGAFSSVRLRRAGDVVLQSWMRARRVSIEDGAVRQFRFKPSSGEFRVELWSPLDVAGSESTGAAKGTTTATGVAAASTSSQASTAQAGAASDGEDVAETWEEELPENVTFWKGQFARYDPVADERAVNELAGSGDDWSEPILFFPDGTSSDASIVLQNERKLTLRLSLRGLTGVGVASRPLTTDELDQLQAR
ncbi:MAG: hypothetical protein KDA61_15665 [Planctomycetales bacterium]|nr:hypothetical protein [Planctomycetales bacterium]